MDDPLENETEITTGLLKIASGQFELASVQSLSLASLGIRRIRGLNPLSSLTSLDLSGNRIVALENLEPVANHLRFLNLRNNKLTSLEGLQRLRSLTTLHVEGNHVAECTQVVAALTALHALRGLYLQEKSGACQNPVCAKPNYKSAVLAALPKLACLDGKYFLKPTEPVVDVASGSDPAARELPDFILPPSHPWLTETYWEDGSSSSSGSSSSRKSTSEATFQAAVVEAKRLLGRADTALESAQKALASSTTPTPPTAVAAENSSGVM